MNEETSVLAATPRLLPHFPQYPAAVALVRFHTRTLRSAAACRHFTVHREILQEAPPSSTCSHKLVPRSGGRTTLARLLRNLCQVTLE